ncbi:unnamed protein product [Bursaphelenchus xylophilus]|uniref:(pine wood nematode) hypothetical protein n=1 Tax=Bursaphelenchus xylophilus TaxID=6326 RepID=A0A1I7RKQ1_BURXY|nr:unnamed protein product [Bursaphelenchus xylophilus]CAG9131166.1 unnamed protein product [Bursaphelenchus xylophilus]
MKQLLTVITSLRKLNADLSNVIDVINNLIGQIREVESLDPSELVVKTLGLLYLSASEEMEKLKEFMDKLAGFIQILTEKLMDSEEIPSETYLNDITILLQHLSMIYNEHTKVIDQLHDPKVRNFEPFSTKLNIIEGDYDVVCALQRLRSDLTLYKGDQ